MKKIGKIGCLGVIGFLILGIIGMALGMGGDTEPAEVTAPTTEPAPAEEAPAATPEPKEEAPKEEAPKTAGIGEEVAVGDVAYKVISRTEADNVGGEYGVNATGKYLVLEVMVKNNGNEALLVDTSLFKIKSGERTYEADGEASIFANDTGDFFLTEVNPGLELVGKVVFDIPAEAHAEELILNVQTGWFGTETGEIALQ